MLFAWVWAPGCCPTPPGSQGPVEFPCSAERLSCSLRMQSGRDPDLSLPCPVCVQSLLVLLFQGSSLHLFCQETAMPRAPISMLAMVPLGGPVGPSQPSSQAQHIIL